MIVLALFPGPAQLSVACSTECWAGPGNKVRTRGEPGNEAMVVQSPI